MTELEQKMYRILGAVSASDIPMVFKGALITKLVLAESGFSLIERPTADIDADWVGTPPTMDNLTDTVNQSLKIFDGELYAVAEREYTDKRTAGLSIIDADTDARIISMDIGIRPVIGSKIYYYGEMGIRGVLPSEIMADKISVLSGRYIFRRAKDMVDVYALAHCVRVQTSEIYSILRNKDRTLGAFTEFYSSRQDVGHAYERLRGIEGKPSFDEVYSFLDKFVRPFAERDKALRIWNIDRSAWEDDLQRKEERSSVLDQIRAAKETRQDNSHSIPKKSKHIDEPEL
jgi:hypothetical protein